MASQEMVEVIPDIIVHRIGGGDRENLQLSQIEKELLPPGVSVLLGGTPYEAAVQMRQAFPGSRKWRERSRRVGTTTVKAIRNAGFDIVIDPTARFPNHARLIHPDGIAGFTDVNLERLAQVFDDTLEA